MENNIQRKTNHKATKRSFHVLLILAAPVDKSGTAWI